MKKLIPVILCIFFLSGCMRAEPAEETLPPPEPEFVTDINGKYVPVIENVNRSQFDPSLFSPDENGRMQYSDENVSYSTGIDISAFQGDINWNEVKNDGIDFVILRIGGRGYGTKGQIYEDEKFHENYEGAGNAGLDVGVYFFSQAVTPEEAEEEAGFVLRETEGLELDYPVVYDWEHIDDPAARTAGMTNEQITACAKAFCDVIESAGKEVIIYFNCSQGYFSFDLSELINYNFWLAEYSEVPSFLYDYKMWQYTCTGEVKGIKTPVDINISFYNFTADEADAG